MIQSKFKTLFDEQAFKLIFHSTLQEQIEQDLDPHLNSISAMNAPLTIQFEGGHMIISPLYYAIKLGHMRWVTYLLQQGTNPNWRDEEILWAGHFFKPKYNALHHVILADLAVNQQIELTRLLLSYSAHPNAKDRLRQTPLHLLVQYPFNLKRQALAACFIEQGANPFIRNRAGLTVIDNAMRHNEPKWAEWLRSIRAQT